MAPSLDPIATYFHFLHLSINPDILCLDSSQLNPGVVFALVAELIDLTLILFKVLLTSANIVRWTWQSPYKVILSPTIKKKYLYRAELYYWSMISHLPANWVEVIAGRSLMLLYCLSEVVEGPAVTYEGFGPDGATTYFGVSGILGADWTLFPWVGGLLVSVVF